MTKKLEVNRIFPRFLRGAPYVTRATAQDCGKEYDKVKTKWRK